jgi:hypothetical protein
MTVEGRYRQERICTNCAKKWKFLVFSLIKSCDQAVPKKWHVYITVDFIDLTRLLWIIEKHVLVICIKRF